ncbi:hypothetical protein ACTXNC_04350 [Psychrobacter celer]
MTPDIHALEECRYQALVDKYVKIDGIIKWGRFLLERKTPLY